jgi:hypothetical protein
MGDLWAHVGAVEICDSHPHGDAVIQRVAQILSDRRPSDRAYSTR